MPALSTLLVIDHDKHALDRMAFGFEREGMLVARTTAVDEAGAIVRDRKPQVIVAGLPADNTAALDLIRKLRSNGTAGVPMIALGELGGSLGRADAKHCVLQGKKVRVRVSCSATAKSGPPIRTASSSVCWRLKSRR